MNEKLNPLAFGTAGAIVAAAGMLVLSVVGKLGMYTSAVEAMSQWHMFYSLTPMGIIAGIVEAAVVTFVFFYLFAWIYSKLTHSA